MYVNHDRKLIYLAHPRTASTSTAKFLMEHAGFVSEGEHHSGQDWPHHYYGGWRKFTTVRNHFDTILSWAATGLGTETAKMPPLSYDRWFREFSGETNDNRNDYIAEHTLWHLHYEDADYIVFYETLEADLSRILEMEVELPWLGESKRRKREWRSYYDAASYAYVAGRFREEMRHLGYLTP